jgi:hypothetical protein
MTSIVIGVYLTGALVILGCILTSFINNKLSVASRIQEIHAMGPKAMTALPLLIAIIILAICTLWPISLPWLMYEQAKKEYDE